jgi:hypothetical protein
VRRRLRPALGLALAFGLASCDNDYNYARVVEERPDIHEVATCSFQPTEGGWEQYGCSPVFSARDPETQGWESESVGDFDIVQREIFGAPFYQMWYSASGGDGNHIGHALSMDGVTWRRHPWNPVLRQGRTPSAFDRNDASVACVAFDGDTGAYHLWYTGTNSGQEGTTFGHATSADGVLWSKDLLNPLEPFSDVDSALSRVWGCDALYEERRFHFWVGGITWDEGTNPFVSEEEFLASVRYDVGYLETVDGSHFEGSGELLLEHRGLLGEGFDAEGVHRPSVFTFEDESAAEAAGGAAWPRYWMLYSGYHRVTATPEGASGLITISADGLRLGVASSEQADGGWTKLSLDPVPLDFSGEERADSPRAFFINGRVHVFFTDRFPDPFGGEPFSGIGLGIAPFPQESP